MNMLLEGCLEPAKGSCEADADACLAGRHATLFDRLQGHARCLQKISLRTSHHESVGWQALPWMYRRGSRSWSGRDLILPSVTSKFCPMHVFFIPPSNFLPPGVCLKTRRVGVETSTDTMVDPQPIHW